ncbi:hypothetical protein N482_08920 [Pseudoalteromonas luteoviolacea NCIMB 1942]|uniref:Aminotransferase class V domain-containing protein n=1 Tax=Pseudoalteromonas luteoviolacea NCIMB 1942 TaxID=1365253 RepID=A0A167CJH9_9GAMM|nr:hypothetical protein N482_08920 [Pseudoalteromonas luteoviolacea NCIMB 1942]
MLALNYSETQQPEIKDVNEALLSDPTITHVAMVHCETTTGILNPAKEIAAVVNRHKKVMILDAMSSFGGIPFDIADWKIDVLISSANKCIQGVPGFSFVIAKKYLCTTLKIMLVHYPSIYTHSGKPWNKIKGSGVSPHRPMLSERLPKH